MVGDEPLHLRLVRLPEECDGYVTAALPFCYPALRAPLALWVATIAGERKKGPPVGDPCSVLAAVRYYMRLAISSSASGFA